MAQIRVGTTDGGVVHYWSIPQDAWRWSVLVAVSHSHAHTAQKQEYVCMTRMHRGRGVCTFRVGAQSPSCSLEVHYPPTPPEHHHMYISPANACQEQQELFGTVEGLNWKTHNRPKGVAPSSEGAWICKVSCGENMVCNGSCQVVLQGVWMELATIFTWQDNNGCIFPVCNRDHCGS